jgi:hypothetical protein
VKHKTKEITVAMVVFFSLACGVVVNNAKFESAKWKNGDERARGKMVYDLQNSKILIGKTKREVAEMLYESERMKEFSEDLSKNAWHFSTDTNTFWDLYFAVYFDEKTERVVSTNISD